MSLKKLTTTLLIISISIFAAEHPGLRNAINKNDIKTAENLVKKFKVTDIYCPAGLSWANTKKIYGDYFVENPEKMFLYCDKGYIDEYEKVACTSKNEIPLCLEILKNQPDNKKVVLLERVLKNKLQNGTEIYDTTETVKEKMTPNEKANCMSGVKASGVFLKQLENSFRSQANDNFIAAILVASLKSQIDSVKTEIKQSEAKCKAGIKDVQKPVKKTRPKNYFINVLKDVESYLEESLFSYFKYGENEKKLLDVYRKLSGKYSELKTENEIIESLIEQYSNNSDLDDKPVLAACRLYPKIDKSFEKKAGLGLFSCKTTLGKYNLKCDDNNKGEIQTITSTVSDQNSTSFICNGVSWNEVSPLVQTFGMCDSSKMYEKHKFDETLYGCDGNDWIELNQIEYDIYGKKCGAENDGAMLKSKKNNNAYVCKNNSWTYGMLDRKGDFVESELIGNTVWNIKSISTKVPKSFCALDEEEKCVEYNRMYTFSASRNVCPEGWKLPSRDDVENLSNHLASRNKQARSNFGQYPSSMRTDDGSDRELSDISFFWLDDSSNEGLLGKIKFENNAEKISVFEDSDAISYGIAVRCIKKIN